MAKCSTAALVFLRESFEMGERKKETEKAGERNVKYT
jgi:hypothetical protein